MAWEPRRRSYEGCLIGVAQERKCPANVSTKRFRPRAMQSWLDSRFLIPSAPTHTTPHSPQSFQHLFGVHWQVHTFGVTQSRRPGQPMSSHYISWFRVGCPGNPHGPVQFGIPLSGSSWEDGKLIRGTTCVLVPPSPGSARRLSGHRPVGIRQGGCLLHERAFSWIVSSPVGG